MYINLKENLKNATAKNICVGAFNMHTLDMLPHMIRAAKEHNTPIIIQTSVGIAEYTGYGVIVDICKRVAEEEGIDVTLHLDHAKDMKDIKNAIDAGYNSVMFDGSALPLEENIRRTQEVVAYAHPKGVSVEGELGCIGGTEDGETVDDDSVSYTEVEDVIEYVDKTNVDALAIAIGTSHGQFKSKTNLNFPLLEEIHETVDIPLVVHGGTGVKEEDVPKLINNGIRKFNVGTEQLVAWTQQAKEQFAQTKINESLRNNIKPCNDKVVEVVKAKSKVFLNE